MNCIYQFLPKISKRNSIRKCFNEPQNNSHTAIDLPPLKNPYILPTCTKDFKEYHIKVLRRLNKHPKREPFSGLMTLEVDIPNFIPILLNLDLVREATYSENIALLKNEALKAILRSYRLKVSGKKQQLIDRIHHSLCESDVKSNSAYSEFYIVTEKGWRLIDASYEHFATIHADFFKKSIELMKSGNLDLAYRIICKRNAENPVPPGIGCDWESRYYKGIPPSLYSIFKNHLDNTTDFFIVAAAIFSAMSGDSFHEIQRCLLKAYSIEIDSLDLRYACSKIYGDINFFSYKQAGIKKYMFSSTEDNETCPVCAQLNSKVFKVKNRKIGINCPPMHKGCRCTTLAHIE
ncbi:MAG: minor capsid protein [Clostridiales bacterium]|nr:minor capsid protein [Clostridiales bacterium]